jgi:CRISPR-associated protein Csx10
MIWVGGFNAKWGLPLPQTWAVQQGSVWQLRAKKAIPAGTVTRILSEGVGDRRAEGFGQLLINPTWLQENPQRKLAGEGADNEEFGQPDVEVEIPKLKKETADLLQTMNERLAGQELDRLLQESAIQLAASFQGNLSHSQLGRLRQRIRDVQANSGGDLSGFAAYLAATKDRKSADEQFRKVSIKNPVKGRQNFRDWMRELAGHPANVWEQIGLTAQDSTWQKGRDGLWQRSFLGNQPLVLNQEKANYYAARLIEAVCELLSRGETK